MKYLLTILVISLLHTLNASAQKSEVIIDSSQLKADIFSKSLVWITQTWKNANNVIDLKDEQSGIIIVKGGLSSVPKTLGMSVDGFASTQLTIRVKDGKAKLEFDNTKFTWKGGSVVWTTTEKPNNSPGQYNKWKDSILKELDDLIVSYKKELSKHSDF